MKKVLLLFISFFFILFNFNLFCCGGSCLKCHPNLNFQNPKEHAIIKTCINCHKKGCGKEEKDDLFISTSENNACGRDCFQCHTVLPKDQAHAQISKCVKCHKSVNISHD